jgi:hypothetical protein
MLPGGKCTDKYCYARFDIAGLPDLEVTWGELDSSRLHDPQAGIGAHKSRKTAYHLLIRLDPSA